MSSQWVNKYAIMRDLSLAQGLVPVDVEGTVGEGEKPPSPNIVEETEEEFYHNYMGGDGDFKGPDIALINHMLVSIDDYNSDTSRKEEEDDDKVLKISKMNPLCPEFVSEFGNTNSPKKVKPKVRKGRNVAMASLLDIIKQEKNARNEHNGVKLLKPADFSGNTSKAVNGWHGTQKPKTPEPTSATEKVNQWFNTKVETKAPESKTKFKKLSTLEINPSTMFKKKNISPNSVKEPPKEVLKSPVKNTDLYVPSPYVQELYNKYVQRAKIRDVIHEDVWTKAERQMKEIDERRKAEAELFAMSLAMEQSTTENTVAVTHTTTENTVAVTHTTTENTVAVTHTTTEKTVAVTHTTLTSLDDPKADAVRLPQHRHTLNESCIVCEVMDKNYKKPDNNNNKCNESSSNSNCGDSNHNSNHSSGGDDSSSSINNSNNNSSNNKVNINNSDDKKIENWRSNTQDFDNNNVECWRSDSKEKNNNNKTENWRSETENKECLADSWEQLLEWSSDSE